MLLWLPTQSGSPQQAHIREYLHQVNNYLRLPSKANETGRGGYESSLLQAKDMRRIDAEPQFRAAFRRSGAMICVLKESELPALAFVLEHDRAVGRSLKLRSRIRPLQANISAVVISGGGASPRVLAKGTHNTRLGLTPRVSFPNGCSSLGLAPPLSADRGAIPSTAPERRWVCSPPLRISSKQSSAARHDPAIVSARGACPACGQHSEACPSASHITAAQKPDVCGLCTQPRLVRKRFTPGPPSLPPLGRADAGLTALLDGGERPTGEPRPGQVANGHGRTQCDGHRAFRRLCENAGTFDHP
ncbi:hypothetical protein PtB15_6B175 [Puccinia triticina]|nr:hypothetical protein PtB15_6B175 [Puccinia triticina]